MTSVARWLQWGTARGVLAWVLLCALAVVTPLSAQADGVLARSDDTLRSEIEAARTSLALAEALTPEKRTELEEKLDQAEAQLDIFVRWQQAAAESREALESGPAEIERLKAEREDEPIESVELGADISSSELEPRLADAEAALRSSQDNVETLEEQIRLAAERREALPEVITAARAQLEEVDTRVAQLAIGDDTSLTDRAQALVTRARQLALRAEVASYEAERTASELRDELFVARLTSATRRRAALEERVSVWRERLASLQRADAEADVAAAERALREAAEKHPVVEALAEGNARYANQRTGEEGLLARIAEVRKNLDETRRRTVSLVERQARLKQRSEAAGNTQSVGFLLVEERSRLPDVADLRQLLEENDEVTSAVQLKRFDLKDESTAFIDVDASVEQAMEDLTPPLVDASKRGAVEASVREQYERRREYLNALSEDYAEYLSLADDLETAQRDLIAKTETFSHFIDERVLWVRIASPIYEDIAKRWRGIRDDLEWLISVSAWVEFARALRVTFEREGGLIILRVVLLAAFFAMRPALRRRIDSTAELVRRLRTDQFRHTVHVFGITVMLAASLPLVFWFLSVLLQSTALNMTTEADVIDAAAGGMLGIAWALFVAGFVVRVCRPQGLAEVHFRWPPQALTSLGQNVRWFLLIALPCQFIVSAMIRNHGTGFGENLGRLAFMIGQITIAVFAYRTAHPSRGVLAPLLDEFPNGWLSRLRGLWFPIIVGLPIALVVLAALGYTYSALQLTLRMQESLLLLLALVFGRALLLRWLQVARRRLAVQQFLKRRERPEGGAVDSELDVDDTSDIDVESVSEQSRRLVQFVVAIGFLVGFWVIWSGVLPALTAENVDVRLWTTEVEDYEIRRDLDGTGTPTLVGMKQVWITLGDVLTAIAILIITFVAGSNLPGLLEIAVLQKLPFQQAGRYAITTISRYLILLIGVILAFSMVEIGWGKVQFLAAAVTFGLGFGLQEVFSNFVSGLILLFERPMRVGDTVTVGDVTGSVTRIRMRATTIVTWDRTELIVPNREFITTQVVNWTLSDSVLRVIVRVGIAYGSNVDRAEKLLYKIARENSNVLSDPGPRVVFASFGDSTLDFELRLFVASPELYRTIHHQLNRSIDSEFREAGLEIAFPQRDLHLRTSDASLTIVRRDEARAGGDEPLAGGPRPTDEEDTVRVT